ncbi:MAG: M48 family metalloprotease [Candidatus Heimdallarchaeota archaeon]|nr:M48 family metalloprotease [Candidatus Heimdallarchaeota archaeon]
MSIADYFLDKWNLVVDGNITLILGLIITALGLFFLISEIRTKIKHGTTSENLMLASIAMTFGLVLFFLEHWLLGIALSLFVLAVYQTYQLRHSPVWRELMIISVVTYFVFLVGTVGDKVWELVTHEKTEIFTGWAYNLMLYVFIILALIFFGKKFVLVSRLMSPQVLYLTLFAIVYVALYGIGKLVPGFDNLTWNYLNIYYHTFSYFFDFSNAFSLPKDGNTLGGLVKADTFVADSLLVDRVVFLSLGPWELIIILSILLYFISGWLLTILLGIKPTDDERVLKLVEEVRLKLGIRRKVKVGFVEAPILNAMAYGPLFDQRVAMIASDIGDFSDDDIRGIVAHELAHNKRAHIIWLQILAWIEMIIKKAFLLPATTLDYAAVKVDIAFGWYFLISYGIVAVLYIFVRILEGDADLQTKKAGYGKELAQALYKLEGFYQGVAGDFGLNVQLLTGKEFTEDEKLRFQGEAAIRLYKHIYKPGRWDMVANIFMSHPRTAYRIVAVVDERFSPVKGALLPFWFILPNFIRKRSLKKLSEKREEFSTLISERFNEYHGEDGVKSFIEITRMDEVISEIKGKNIVAYDRTFDNIVEGEVTGITISNTICVPMLLNVKQDDEEKQILLTDNVIHEANIGETYVLKNGKMGELVSWKTSKKSKVPIFQFRSLDDSTEEFEKSYTGKSKSYFEKKIGENIFIYKDGADRRAVLEDIEFTNQFSNSIFKLKVFEKEDIKTHNYKGSELFFELPPALLRLLEDKIEQQTSLIEMIVGKSVILFTKEELETGIACMVTEVNDEKITYSIREKTHEVERKKVDYVYVFSDTPKAMVKKHISLFDRLIARISNWKEMKYVFG